MKVTMGPINSYVLLMSFTKFLTAGFNYSISTIFSHLSRTGIGMSTSNVTYQLQSGYCKFLKIMTFKKVDRVYCTENS